MRVRASISYMIGILAIFVALGGTMIHAGILTTTPNSIPGFQGSRTFSDGPVLPPFFMDAVTANVDFAVFAPTNSGTNTFDQFLTGAGISFSHSVPNDHYVYAYQIEVLSASPAAHLFTVGTEFSGMLGGIAPSFIPIADGGGDEDATTTAYQNGTSALWEYKTTSGSSFTGNLDSTESSGIMFFSSTDGPLWDSAQLTAGLASGKSNAGEDYSSTGLAGTGVPVPAPEPGSLVLLAMGLCSALAMGGRRRNRG